MRVAFIHGRPGPHPFHKKLAETVKADFIFVDEKIRWHDKECSPIRRYFSWMINSLLFPARNYDVILSEGLHFTPLLIKILNPFKKIKTVALVDNEQPYFLKEGRYSKITSKILVWALNSYDALICSGEMIAGLCKGFISSKEKVFTIYNGVSESRMNQLQQINPATDSNTVIFIGNGPAPWRGWYKGIDILLKSFSVAASENESLKLILIGEWDEPFLSEEIKKYANAVQEKIEVTGKVSDLASYLSKASLYLHPARGEAYGISVLEAMAAGNIPVVSEWTGAKEVVAQVSPELVIPLQVEDAVNSLKWFLALTSIEKEALSRKAKEVVLAYTEEAASARFRNAFKEAIAYLDNNNEK